MVIFDKIKYIFIILLFLYLGCKGSNNMRDNKGSYYDGKNFYNLDNSKKPPSLSDVIYWQSTRNFINLPSLNPKDYNFEVLENQGELIKSNNSKFSITWIGHATTLIQLNGKNILTDPIWSDRCSPVNFAGPKRYTKPGLTFENLPKIDIVLISHNHYDHMDLPTLKKLDQKFNPIFFVGLKNKNFLINEGLDRVVELDWWELYKLDEISITFTPTQHSSARGVFDKDTTLWGSFVVQGSKNSFYFAGDTAYFPEFNEIGNKFPGIDLAILPIGAYEPRWFMKVVHMNPEEAILSFSNLKAKYMVPIHYQTFVLTDEPLDEPLKKTREIFINKFKSTDRLLDLKIGESRFF